MGDTNNWLHNYCHASTSLSIVEKWDNLATTWMDEVLKSMILKVKIIFWTNTQSPNKHQHVARVPQKYFSWNIGKIVMGKEFITTLPLQTVDYSTVAS